ncbi:hypothetical protein BH10ACT1_BH10ACT1_13310 [soil metagenome]
MAAAQETTRARIPRPADVRRWARWVGAIAGFPAAGLAARLVAGDIDSVGAAAVGGLAAGLVLGSAEVTIGGAARDDRARWVLATGVGFAGGLAAGAAAVGYRTDAASLALMGAFTGAGVGVAQAASIPMRTVDRIVWAVSVPVLWALAWTITANVIVDADRRHAAFGLSGALVANAFTGILHARRVSTGPIDAASAIAPATGMAVPR